MSPFLSYLIFKPLGSIYAFICRVQSLLYCYYAAASYQHLFPGLCNILLTGLPVSPLVLMLSSLDIEAWMDLLKHQIKSLLCSKLSSGSLTSLKIKGHYNSLRVLEYRTPGLHPSTKATNKLAKTVRVNFCRILEPSHKHNSEQQWMQKEAAAMQWEKAAAFFKIDFIF